MRVVLDRPKPIELGDNIKAATGFFTRLSGLAFRKRIGEGQGLLLAPCPAIHTFFMRFAIDVVYLSDRYRVVGIEEGLAPSRVGKRFKGAWAVLELPEGTVKRHNLRLGEKLLIFE